MASASVRGSAMNWVYLCEQCKVKLWPGFEGRKKPKCELCDSKFDAPMSIRFCQSCSYETNICMGCGGKIQVEGDYDELVEKALTSKPPKKRRRRKRKP